MEKRRQFLKKSLKLITGLGAFLYPFSSAVGLVYAKTKKTILPKNTTRQSLISKNPANLDTRNLEITPLKDFRTMGITDHSVNLNEWNLEVAGDVRTPLLITYSELRELPSVERDVLLICPGIFVNNGRWKGISMKALLDKAGAVNGSTHVTFSGPKGDYEKSEQYPIGDVLSNKVFLAYAVNGKTLPQKHGFPLRLVAEDYYGSDWVKFVYKVTVETA
jgi:sulfoxide reductase catalytic subunit YedY